MPLNPSFVGRSYPPTRPYEVGREKIREFAEAIGDANPVYVDPEAAKAFGYSDVIAPPTFSFVITIRAQEQIIMDPDLGLDFDRVVHRDQKFVHARPIRSGDRLSVTMKVDSVQSLVGNDILSYRADVHDISDEQVVTVFTTLVARAAAEPTEAA